MLVDDHPLVLEGIRACLENYEHIHVVAEVNSGEAALSAASDTKPDVILMDINMPGLNGLDATELIRERLPESKLLILSMHDNKEYISNALMYGAQGYVLKDVPTREIVTAIEAIHAGATYFSSGVSHQLLSGQAEKERSGALTSREQTVLVLLAEGKSNKEVARELEISVRTVETHRKNIKSKLEISSTAGLTRYALEHGLLAGPKSG
ncbi:response regulator transcription factor [Pelagibius marinus]|uniref:response regulator transcription factor n=1 Tax=Pelagibius marinus TaxID=2762760 RepID=UPI002AC34FE1|nr:response regulator transcription factor [Pelagibius marinus]